MLAGRLPTPRVIKLETLDSKRDNKLSSVWQKHDYNYDFISSLYFPYSLLNLSLMTIYFPSKQQTPQPSF